MSLNPALLLYVIFKGKRLSSATVLPKADSSAC